MEEFVHRLDAEGFGLEGLVFLDELEQGGLLVGLEGGVHHVNAEGFYFSTLLGGLPSSVCVELCEHAEPFLFGDCILLGEFRVQHQGFQGGESALPCGVDAAVQGELAVG